MVTILKKFPYITHSLAFANLPWSNGVERMFSTHDELGLVLYERLTDQSTTCRKERKEKRKKEVVKPPSKITITPTVPLLLFPFLSSYIVFFPYAFHFKNPTTSHANPSNHYLHPVSNNPSNPPFPHPSDSAPAPLSPSARSPTTQTDSPVARTCTRNLPSAVPDAHMRRVPRSRASGRGFVRLERGEGWLAFGGFY